MIGKEKKDSCIRSLDSHPIETKKKLPNDKILITTCGTKMLSQATILTSFPTITIVINQITGTVYAPILNNPPESPILALM
jgi:hypothetical protein